MKIMVIKAVLSQYFPASNILKLVIFTLSVYWSVSGINEVLTVVHFRMLNIIGKGNLSPKEARKIQMSVCVSVSLYVLPVQ